MSELQHGYFGGKSIPGVIQASNLIVISALGGCLSYLRSVDLDRTLVSQGQFRVYNVHEQHGNLMLDGQALVNLEALQNTHNGSEDGTLWRLLMHCTTRFGKRLFRRWLCHPLQHIPDIEERLDAVQELLNHREVMAEASAMLGTLGDLERLLARLQSGSMQLESFLTLLEGVETLWTLISSVFHTEELAPGDYGGSDGNDAPPIIHRPIFQSQLLYNITAIVAALISSSAVVVSSASSSSSSSSSGEAQRSNNDGDGASGGGGIDGSEQTVNGFPDLSEIVEQFQSSIDKHESRTARCIIPRVGFDAQYDEALAVKRSVCYYSYSFTSDISLTHTCSIL